MSKLWIKHFAGNFYNVADKINSWGEDSPLRADNLIALDCATGANTLAVFKVSDAEYAAMIQNQKRFNPG